MRYILGFDGGGTKTECVLMNSDHQILARTYAGPSNPSRIGVEAAARAIEQAARFALKEAGLERSAIVAIGAGLAGTAKPDMKQRMTLALQDSFLSATITVLTDLEAALAAAGEGPSIVLVAGTGSAAIGCNAQFVRRCIPMVDDASVEMFLPQAEPAPCAGQISTSSGSVRIFVRSES